jgi:MATE family multidrug resistance protein
MSTAEMNAAPSTDVEKASTFGEELRALVRLGVPIVASMAGSQVLGFVDAALVGRLDAVSLAAVGIGNGIFFTLSLVAMGIVLGMDPLVSQAIGAGDGARARAVLWQAVWIALVSSLPAIVLMLIASAFIEHIGIDVATSKSVYAFILGRFFSVVPFLVFTAGRTYLQAIGKAGAAAWAYVWTNIANVIGNVILIYGDPGLERLGLPAIGLPPLGGFGAGLSSTIASFVTLFVIYRAVMQHGGRPASDDFRKDVEIMRRIFRLGWPIGMHLLAEVGAFSLAGIFAGWLGPRAAAGHQVALGLASMSFVFALGVANATAVRVGLAVGRNDSAGVRRAGFAGLLAGAMMMSVSIVLFAFAPALCARILSDKPDIIEAAIPLLRIAAIFQLADSTQVIAAGALRGVGDTHTTQVANMIGYYIVGLPLALILGFGFHLGAPGIWWGLTASLFGVAVTLVIKFVRVSRREIHRI